MSVQISPISLSNAAASHDWMTAPAGPASARQWQRGYARRLALTDLILASGTLAAVHWLALPELSVLSTAVLLALWLTALGAARSRDWRHIGAGVTEYRRVLVASVTSAGLFFATLVALNLPTPREHLIWSLPMGVLSLLLGRWVWRRVLQRKWRSGIWTHRAVVVGHPGKINHVVSAVQGATSCTGTVVIATHPVRGDLTGGDAAARERLVAQIVDVVTSSAADLVLLTETDLLSAQAVRELGWALDALDVNLVVVPSLTETAGSRISSHMIAGVPLLHVAYPRLTGRARILKRSFDVLVSALALLMLAPGLAIIAVCVRLDSPGPVLFRQERVGINHSRFSMLKFRSMVVDAERYLSLLKDRSEGNEVLFKMRRDPRVTRVGAVLRRLSLDELPQFYNVLRGEMSVVGPRPPLPQEVEAYDDTAHRRLLVKPGITGLWQVTGRSDLSWEESIRLDLYYVENWTLLGDIQIVLRTARAVFGGTGAY
ncbi:sugar transferase [Nesterenkonia sandarakina]|uniref:Exopolysaccharide biosynthesis polyprenyl glycosylphosphotransferase n=1 Tax=Nesterenkonia sandarakina TaxID=272918 RepID=A0A7Z0EA78_9MICC|nr:sugar transferase [Nesterenkonia sandarakina]NYJ17818.1 exopolysaccharide biosynthesis polyprenyl glycosylphosphotransferase [Nesterenkonia sandarakina]